MVFFTSLLVYYSIAIWLTNHICLYVLLFAPTNVTLVAVRPLKILRHASHDARTTVLLGYIVALSNHGIRLGSSSRGLLSGVLVLQKLS